MHAHPLSLQEEAVLWVPGAGAEGKRRSRCGRTQAGESRCGEGLAFPGHGQPLAPAGELGGGALDRDGRPALAPPGRWRAAVTCSV